MIAWVRNDFMTVGVDGWYGRVMNSGTRRLKARIMEMEQAGAELVALNQDFPALYSIERDMEENGVGG